MQRPRFGWMEKACGEKGTGMSGLAGTSPGCAYARVGSSVRRRFIGVVNRGSRIFDIYLRDNFIYGRRRRSERELFPELNEHARRTSSELPLSENQKKSGKLVNQEKSRVP